MTIEEAAIGAVKQHFWEGLNGGAPEKILELPINRLVLPATDWATANAIRDIVEYDHPLR